MNYKKTEFDSSKAVKIKSEHEEKCEEKEDVLRNDVRKREILRAIDEEDKEQQKRFLNDKLGGLAGLGGGKA